jgi:hypothetical protein
MSTTLSTTDRRYLDRLAVHLRLLHVPGDRIGEILAEAEAHAAESGESLREAFGDPRSYACRWAPCPPPWRWRGIIPALVGGAGWFTLTCGATAVAMHQRLPVVGLPAWTLLVVGAVLAVGWAATAPLDRIRDPRTGAHRGRSRTTVVLLALAMCAAIAAAGGIGAALH